MATLTIEVDDQLVAWAEQAAEREQVSLEEYIELLIAMESSIKDRSRDGRQISIRTSIYRGRDPVLIDDRAYVGKL